MSRSNKDKGTKQRGPRFSNYHPLLPKRYVPAWQLDMKNRAVVIQVRYNLAANNYILLLLLLQNGKIYGSGDNWKGHVSYFLQGRGQ